jgi:hypothetical protein
LAIFLSISFKYFLKNAKDSPSILKIIKEYSHNDSLKSGNSFEKKKVREIIKSKMAHLKSAVTYSFFLLIQSNIYFAFFFFSFFFSFANLMWGFFHKSY